MCYTLNKVCIRGWSRRESHGHMHMPKEVTRGWSVRLFFWSSLEPSALVVSKLTGHSLALGYTLKLYKDTNEIFLNKNIYHCWCGIYRAYNMQKQTFPSHNPFLPWFIESLSFNKKTFESESSQQGCQVTGIWVLKSEEFGFCLEIPILVILMAYTRRQLLYIVVLYYNTWFIDR